MVPNTNEDLVTNSLLMNDRDFLFSKRHKKNLFMSEFYNLVRRKNDNI
jgi:hypothetical protein